jgi:AcrR family transcriptional regulator
VSQESESVRRRQRRSSEQVRGLVLAAARELFLEQGYDATTIAQIVERSGVSRAVMFRHFSDKAALHRAALEPSAADKSLAEQLREAEQGVPEARRKLLDAARDLFSAHGFGNTATRQIAERAGVPEAALYRHFGSKAGLFREAVFEPFGEFIAAYSAHWSGTPPVHSAADVLREYLEGLFRLLRANSAAAMTLLAARAHEPPGVAVAEGQQRVLLEIIQPLENLTKSEAATFGYTGLNAAISTRASVSMVLAMALFKEWLFDETTPATDEEIIDELQAMILHGIAHRGDGAR